MKIGIVGCGAIGKEIARAITKKVIPAQLVAVCDKDISRSQSLVKKIHSKARITTLQKLVSLSDIVVESAGIHAVKEIAEQCIKKKKTLVIMSVGYLLSDINLIERAQKKKCRIIFPSGAIAGLDGVRAAQLSGIHSATLTTTKPPRGLKGAPYFKTHPVDLERLKKPTLVFNGSASQAVKGFPVNINVAAILSLAGIGARRTRVKIVANPQAHKNIHEIEVEGKSGKIVARTENVPSPTNPKTSYLAILSAISILKQLCTA